MQMCLGATYSWSVYVGPLRELTGMLQGPTQLPFTFFYFVFPAVMIISGTLLPRLGPRFCSVLGGLLFGSGWILASWGDVHFAFTVLGIGILAGVGVGFAYIVPIATCIRWFPEHKGLVTGVAVAGFGGGAALVSQIGGRLMHLHGATPFETFRIFGIAFALLVPLAGLVMKNPQVQAGGKSSTPKVRGVVNTGPFRLLYFAMFSGLAAGFAVNANLKELFMEGSAATGILAVSLFAAANALGRLTWGFVFDRLPSATAIQANLFAQAAVLVGGPWVLRSETGLLVFSLLTGFNYGGVLVVYASSAARIWGNERVGSVYGRLFSSNIPAALAPIAAGVLFDWTGSFTLPLWFIGGMLTVAALMVKRNSGRLTEESDV